MNRHFNFEQQRKHLVEKYIIPRGIKDSRVIAALLSVPREYFVTESQKKYAYDDRPLPILNDQTISQPYIVALMTELLELPDNRDAVVLEIGTGSGYQSAILAAMGYNVKSVERIPRLAEFAKNNLKKTKFLEKVHVKVGDGSKGIPEYAPYDGIIVTAASPEIPEPLKFQLKINSNLVIPVGKGFYQQLLKITRVNENKFTIENHGDCSFVPLIGKYAFKP